MVDRDQEHLHLLTIGNYPLAVMARAVFQYFNIFSMMYTGKPLVTGKGAVQRRIDPRQLFIYGNLASAQNAQPQEDEAQSQVPSSWELIARRPAAKRK